MSLTRYGKTTAQVAKAVGQRMRDDIRARNLETAMYQSFDSGLKDFKEQAKSMVIIAETWDGSERAEMDFDKFCSHIRLWTRYDAKNQAFLLLPGLNFPDAIAEMLLNKTIFGTLKGFYTLKNGEETTIN